MSLLSNLQAKIDGKARRAMLRGKGVAKPSQALEGYTPEGFVARIVGSLDSKPQTARGGAGYIHGSSLIGLCPRRYALMIRGGGAKQEQVRSADRLCWAIGRAVEHHIREQFISAVGEIVLGKWVCYCGKLQREGLQDLSFKCESCGGSAKNYRELGVFDHDYRIVGSPDLPYLRPDIGKVRVVEIKSINKNAFEKLTNPNMDHVYQALIYRRLFKKNDISVDDSVTVLYGSKDYSFRGSPYLEFTIKETEQHRTVLDGMWQKAAEVRDFLKAEEGDEKPKLPPRLAVCASSTDTKPKGCDQCHACFSVS